MTVVLVHDDLPGQEYETTEAHANVLARSGWYEKPAAETPSPVSTVDDTTTETDDAGDEPDDNEE